MKRKSLTMSCSPALRRLLLALEVNCFADCCKAAAFDLAPARVRTWLQLESTDRSAEIYEELFNLRDSPFDDYDIVKLRARHLESEWGSGEFSQFLDSLIQCIHKAVYSQT